MSNPSLSAPSDDKVPAPAALPETRARRVHPPVIVAKPAAARSLLAESAEWIADTRLSLGD